MGMNKESEEETKKMLHNLIEEQIRMNRELRVLGETIKMQQNKTISLLTNIVSLLSKRG